MVSVKKIIIASVCSRKFNSKLMSLLESLDNCLLPKNTKLKKIIVFNSADKNNLILLKKNYKKKLEIFYEKKKGVSNARNKILNILKNKKFDYGCFFDDDSTVSKKWFIENFIFFKKNLDTDIIGGPQIFKSKKKYLKSLELDYEHGSKVRWVSTNNVFFKKKILKKKLYFSNNLNAIFQGEDQLFFSQLNLAGYVMRWNKKSFVKESISKNKNSFAWFLRRNYKYGLAGGFIDKKLYGNLLGLIINLLKILYNFILLILLFFKMFLNFVYFYKLLGVALRIFGRFLFLIGLKKIK